MSEVEAGDFKAALSSWAAGVTIVTTRHAGLVYGITASSFSSLSVDPLLILVCIANSNHLAHMITDSKLFAVSVLATGQEHIANYFSMHGRDPSPAFQEHVETREWHTGAPIVHGAIAHLDCTLEGAVAGGDHTIMIGRVVGAASNASATPLLYFRRGYRTLNLE
jgi:flavin reductase (DIM6/NTAB) family NADH-FMN oxidoreductase RutF